MGWGRAGEGRCDVARGGGKFAGGFYSYVVVARDGRAAVSGSHDHAVQHAYFGHLLLCGDGTCLLRLTQICLPLLSTTAL